VYPVVRERVNRAAAGGPGRAAGRGAV